MRVCLAFGILLWASAFSTPAVAQDGVACLQAQLTDLGFDPGPVNSTMRPAVREAGQEWGADRRLPELRCRTALSWCREIGLAMPEAQKHWPVNALPQIIETKTARFKALLSHAEAVVRAHFKDLYQIEIAGRVALVGASDAPLFMPAARTALAALNRSTRTITINGHRLCRGPKIGGAANRGFMVFCWPKDEETTAWEAEIAPALRKVMVHEFAHAVQYELAADDPAQQVDGNWSLGPHWIVEGVAELVEWQYDSGVHVVDGEAFFDLQSHAQRSRTILEDLSANGTVVSGQDDGVARFATYLRGRNTVGDLCLIILPLWGGGTVVSRRFSRSLI